MKHPFGYANLSVVIPTLDEQNNVEELVARLVETLSVCTKKYELIFIDDLSKDQTIPKIRKLAKHLPIRIYQKVGKKGKSFSLLQGFKLAKYDIIAMIDADLQYPPEALKQMLSVMADHNDDLVLSRRDGYQENHLRLIGSNLTRRFIRYLFSLDYDVQAGLKLFKKEILESMDFSMIGPWTFDLVFLYQASNANCKIESVDIKFMKRLYGHSKVNFLKVGPEILIFALILKFRIFRQLSSNLSHKIWIRQFIKFSMLGVINTLIDVGIYFILIRSIHFFLIYFVLAKAISYSIATVNSFIFNRRFTFRANNTSFLFIVPFMIAGGIGLLINVGIVYLLVDKFGLSQIYSVAAATATVLIYNFSISKFYIFSK